MVTFSSINSFRKVKKTFYNFSILVSRKINFYIIWNQHYINIKNKRIKQKFINFYFLNFIKFIILINKKG